MPEQTNGGTPQAPQAPAYSPEEVERWRTVANDLETQAQQLAAEKAALADQAKQLEAAAALDHAMRSDRDFNQAVQAAYAQRLQAAQGQQPAAPNWDGQQPQQPVQPHVPPELVAAVQVALNQGQQLGSKVSALEGTLRERELSAQVAQLAAQYPYAEPAEVVAFLAEYPSVRVDAALAASDSHYKARYEAIAAEQERQRQANRVASTLGASGAPAVVVDKQLLRTPGGRRSVMAQALSVLTGQEK